MYILYEDLSDLGTSCYGVMPLLYMYTLHVTACYYSYCACSLWLLRMLMRDVFCYKKNWIVDFTKRFSFLLVHNSHLTRFDRNEDIQAKKHMHFFLLLQGLRKFPGEVTLLIAIARIHEVSLL